MMDREAWRVEIHGVAKSRIWHSNWTFSDKVSVKVYVPFLESSCFLSLSLRFLCTFWITVFSQMCLCKNFVLVCDLSFYSLDIVFCRAEVFNFIWNFISFHSSFFLSFIPAYHFFLQALFPVSSPKKMSRLREHKTIYQNSNHSST